MSYADVARIIAEASERLVEAGVTRSVVETEMAGIEAIFMRDISQAKVDRQFLLELREIGTVAMAERKGRSDRTIREWRQEALKRETERRELGGQAAA